MLPTGTTPTIAGPSAWGPAGSNQFEGQTPALILRVLRSWRRIAVVGLSANPNRPSHFAAVYLIAKGYEVIPVNPAYREVLDRRCYPSLAEVPQPLEVVNLFRRSEDVPPLVEEAIALGAKAIWMQLGVIHLEAHRKAQEAGLPVVMDRCMKIEHARYAGGLNSIGLRSGFLSSRRVRPL